MSPTVLAKMQRIIKSSEFYKFAVKILVPAFLTEIVLFPFWFLQPILETTWISAFGIILTSFILPIWFCVNGVIYINSSLPRKWLSSIIIVLTGILISLTLYYLSWALSVGSVFHPDAETLMILILVAEVSCVVSAVPVMIAMVVRFFKMR